MKANILFKGLLFFVATYAIGASTVFAASTCTHSPQNLTLQAGGSAEVTYTCTRAIPISYALVFTPSGGVSASGGSYNAGSYAVTVSARTSGTLTVSQISLGGGAYVDASDAAGPLQVTVAAIATPTITWTDNTVTATTTADGAKISWNANAKIKPAEPISYQVSLNGGAPQVETSPYSIPANQLKIGANTVTVSATAAGAQPISGTASFNWALPVPQVTGDLSCPASATIGAAPVNCTITLSNANAILPTDIALKSSVDDASVGAGTLGSISACASGTPVSGQNCVANFTFTPTKAGAVKIDAAYSDAQKEAVIIAPFVITVNPKPVPTITWATPNVQVAVTTSDASITWNADATVAPSSAGPVTYSLSLNGNSLSSDAVSPFVIPAATLNPAGSKTVIVTANATDAVGVPADKTFSWSPAPLPVSVAGVLTCSSTVQAGNFYTCSATFTATQDGKAVDIPAGTISASDTGNFTAYTQNCPSGASCIADHISVVVPTDTQLKSDVLTVSYTEAESKVVTNAPPATIAITSAPPSSSGVTGMVNTDGEACTKTQNMGVSSITCNVTYKNTSPTSYTSSQLVFSGAVSPSGSGTIAVSNACSPGLQSINGDTCQVTYTYTPTYPLPSLVPKMQMVAKTTDETLLATVHQTVNFQSQIASSVMTCTPTSVIAGEQTTCTLQLATTSGTILSKENPVVTGLVNGAAPASSTGTFTAGAVPTPIRQSPPTQVTLTYTAPESLGDLLSVNLSANYTDSYGDNVVSNVVPITLATSLTASSIRCNPEIGTPGGKLNCSVIITNVGNEAQALVPMTIAVTNGSSATITSKSCLTNLGSNTSCLVPFNLTASGDNSVGITVSGNGVYPQQTATIPVVLSGGAQIQANPIVCTPSVDHSAYTCIAVFGNAGSSVGSVSVTQGAASIGSISEFKSKGCGSISPAQACIATFTYTPPTNSNSGFAVVSVNAPNAAFLEPVVIPLLNSSSVVPSIIQNADGSRAPNSVEYLAAGSMPSMTLTFNMLNGSAGAITPNVKAVAVSNTGNIIPLPQSALSGSCAVANTLNPKSACDAIISFSPAEYDGLTGAGLNVGDQVTLFVWMQGADGTVISQVGTKTVTVGATPIFATLLTEYPFILQGSDDFKGMFVFSNNSGSSITNVRSMYRVFLPAGFSSTDSCPQKLIDKYFNGSASCDTYAGQSLSTGSSCYVCFNGTSKVDSTFEAQLVYHESISTAKRIIPANPSYRTLKLINQCKGPVWPAFVTGAAYYACQSNADCPANSICDTAAFQCKGSCTAYPSICPNGSTCNTTSAGGKGLCYWSPPGHKDGTPITDWKITSGSGSDEMDVYYPNAPLNDNGDWTVVANGGLVPRTGCSLKNGQFTCDSGQCQVKSSTDNTCAAGALPPATQAEFTLLYVNQDYYDVEVIDGINIPMSMKPTPYTGTPFSSNPHVCNAAGEYIPNSDANFCTWQFNLNKYDLTSAGNGQPIPYSSGVAALHSYVAGGSQASCIATDGSVTACTTPGEVCGLSQVNLTNITTMPKLTCGHLVGAWSSSKLCSVNTQLDYKDPKAAEGTYGAFNCTGTAGTDTVVNWYGCPATAAGAATSCYQNTATKGNCCGCPFWEYGTINGKEHVEPNNPAVLSALFPAGFVLTPPDLCYASATAWTETVQGPSLVWMKQGCSTLYTFPYDDPTSTFTCSTANSTASGGFNPNVAGIVNTQNYTVTFCPNDSSGSPASGKIGPNTIYVAPDAPPPGSGSVKLNTQRFTFLQKIAHKWHTIERKIERDLRWA